MHMSRAKAGLRAVSEAENLVRRLISEAAADNQYADVIALAEMADGLRRLGAAADPNTSATVDAGFAANQRKTPLTKAKKAPRKPGPKATAHVAFPRFERDGDRLVKIGWSKRQGSAYEHRAPKYAVIACVNRIASLAPPGGVFAVDAMMATPIPSQGGVLPAYQVYLVVAWLRSLGLIKKKGRDGYVVSKGVTERAVDDAWGKTTARIP